MSIFEGEAKGELLVLRDQLDGNDPRKRKQAAKRTVALMRQGENVQSLFASMLRCVKTQDIELKRLSYLYLVQYSTHEPEQAIMAVNTFISDSQDPSPLIRGLAVRTMCRIKLENVAEHMLSPLKKSLQDPDPYVRKTAAFGVAKLYDFVPEAVENAGLFQDLLKLLKDENPMVVSNTAAAIFEINEHRTTPIFSLNSDTIGPLLSAITSCTEWCQTILLDTLSKYKPESHDDATFLIDRLIPFLKHSNPSVVIGSFKCIFLFLEIDKRDPKELFPQIIPPFITLVSSAEAEVQYVVLRTLSLFVHKYPTALMKEIRVFFCKYNDPSYVKMEKLDIIVTICGTRAAKLVLDELQEYCNSVDVAFVRKSIRAIGQIAIKIESAARRCVDILSQLVTGRADYSIEEAVCVVVDILRKFPGEFEGIIPKVCSNLEAIKEPRAKASAIWILGEYSKHIDNVDDILDPFLDTFHDEQPIVQLQLLTALVKVYLEKPEQTKDQLQFVLTEATKEGNFPDVKNRAVVYWRILSSDPETAKHIITFPKDTVVHSGVTFEPHILAELIKNMGSVAGVLHVVPSDFVRRVRYVPEDEDSDNDDESIRNWRQVRVAEPSPVDLFTDYDQNNVYLRIVNKTGQALSEFAFALNKNPLGLTINGQADFPAQLNPQEVAEVAIPITANDSVANFDRPELMMALKTNAGNVLAIDRTPVEFFLSPEGDRGQDAFRQAFQTFTSESTAVVEGASIASKEQLRKRNVFFVGKNSEQKKEWSQFALGHGFFVAELSPDADNFNVSIKTNAPEMLPVVIAASAAIFSQK